MTEVTKLQKEWALIKQCHSSGRTIKSYIYVMYCITTPSAPPVHDNKYSDGTLDGSPLPVGFTRSEH